MTIHQTLGLDLLIKILELTEAMKTLRVITNTAGTWGPQLEWICTWGQYCTNNLCTNKYHCLLDGRVIFDIQLKPHVEWGLVCVSVKPDKLDKDNVQFNMLLSALSG